MKTKEEQRKNELAQIHLAKSRLAMDEDTYRAMLKQHGGKESAADLDDTGRDRVLTHLAKSGAKLFGRSRTTGRMIGKSLTERKDPRDLIRSLWIRLAKHGAIKDPSDENMRIFIRKQTEIDALEFLIDPKDQDKVIKSLRGWMRRVGCK